MRRILIFVLNLILLAVASGPALAQDAAQKVAVRSAVHADYTRVVFDWGATPDYTAKQDGSSLTLTFKKSAEFSVATPSPASLARIAGFSTTDNSATLKFADGQTIRHFVIGNRIIVDAKGKPTPPPAKAQEPVKEEPKAEAQTQAEAPPAEAPKTETPVAEAKPEEPPKDAEAKPAEEAVPVKAEESKAAETAAEPAKVAEAQPAPPAEEKPVPQPAQKFDAHMINITATQAVGLTAYTRFGNLWLVLDQPKYPIFPQLDGPQKASFPPFERVDLADATAFKLRLPGDFKIYGEGGGLVWKIILTPTPRNVEPVPFKRSFDQAQKPGGKLIWETPDTRRVVEMTDPEVGDKLKLVSALSSRAFSGKAQEFVELATFDSPVGLAFREKVDDLSVTRTEKAVTITRPNGLALSAESDIASLKMQQKEAPVPEHTDIGEPPKEDEQGAAPIPAKDEKGNPFTRIFAFDRWLMGGVDAMSENQRIIMSAIAEKTDQGKAEDLITLAKMELANGRGPEALGYLEFAGDIIKELKITPEYLALRGAAEALTGQADKAFKDFSEKALNDIAEIRYWKSYSLAQLEDWKQAEDVLPKDVSLIAHYPPRVQIPLGLTLTEVALRAGNTETADKLLEILEKNDDNLSLAHRSALEYLRGESLRQQDDLTGMKDMWDPLAKGPDDLYRAKAGLALTSQLLEKKEMPMEKAIDQLEGLRYAWRGDELETAINYKLGRIYIEDNQPIKGLTLLRQAASLAPNSDLGQQITGFMTRAFKDLYLTNKVQELSPIDALTIYDEFSELIPVGPEGDRIARQLAERLVDADLLPRAENLLQGQIDKRLSGMQGAEVALRLASIQLLDDKPDKAIATLDKANEFLLAVPLEEGATKRREVALLRARALSDQKKPEEAFTALSLLQQDPDVLRLRADIAWRAKRWQDAADTLEELVNKMEIDMTRPMDAEQADAVLNWAVALYLADNRYVLANLREKYSDAMAQTPNGKKFDVVTRPRQNALLADRATINSIIGETDMFKGFLDTFSATAPGEKKAAAPQPAPAAPVAAPPAEAPAKEAE